MTATGPRLPHGKQPRRRRRARPRPCTGRGPPRSQIAISTSWRSSTSDSPAPSRSSTTRNPASGSTPWRTTPWPSVGPGIGSWSSTRTKVGAADRGPRLGFQHLLAEVTMDHVGLVLGLELCRLSRSSKDWYHLVEVCGVFGALLADQDGLYDPNDANDRLVLGLRGTMSEVELFTMRNRLERGGSTRPSGASWSSTSPAGTSSCPPGGGPRPRRAGVRDRAAGLRQVRRTGLVQPGLPLLASERDVHGDPRPGGPAARRAGMAAGHAGHARPDAPPPDLRGGLFLRPPPRRPQADGRGGRQGQMRAVPMAEWMVLMRTACRPTSRGNVTWRISDDWSRTAIVRAPPVRRAGAWR